MCKGIFSEKIQSNTVLSDNWQEMFKKTEDEECLTVSL
jgi:hypothetical protein